MGLEERKSGFRPLIPDVRFIQFNAQEELEKITEHTACVVLETIQGGAGFILPENNYLEKLESAATKSVPCWYWTKYSLSFGRTGKLFAFEHYNCAPDILVIGKGMASGLPVGAFVASHELMADLKDNPKLGHITTFGGILW